MYPTFKSGFTRSMYSTPERKTEIPQENSDKEKLPCNDATLNRNSDSVLTNSKGNISGKGINLSNVNNKSHQHNSSSSNLSEKSRISSVVYPSKKKKNPKNQHAIHQQQQ